jgi:hypothetical protein
VNDTPHSLSRPEPAPIAAERLSVFHQKYSLGEFACMFANVVDHLRRATEPHHLIGWLEIEGGSGVAICMAHDDESPHREVMPWDQCWSIAAFQKRIDGLVDAAILATARA